jgi:hypothetical protein
MPARSIGISSAPQHCDNLQERAVLYQGHRLLTRTDGDGAGAPGIRAASFNDCIDANDMDNPFGKSRGFGVAPAPALPP